jgi:GNAT superfamily N-acetyltransferase
VPVLPSLTVRVAALADVLALRHRELRPGLPLATAAFDRDDEPATLHVGAFLGPACDNVGCASFMRCAHAGRPAYQLRGMATRSDLVGRGVGGAVLRFGEEELRRTGVGLLWCNARVAAVAFYEKMGWSVVSEVFDVPTVGPHHVMRRILS